MPGTYIPINYLPVLIILIAATLIGLAPLLIGIILRPRRPYPAKLSPYESGIPPVGEPRERFSVKFYIIAMLFVVFDVEAVFLYPWAVAYDKIGLYSFIEMMIFIYILLVGYIYAWGKGAIEWE
ncbi:MAG: NADH-quinone oxidoreductase subunit A [Nitrospirae bacterium]|nr:NADH-quinone oxidoreductase subunit A [Nitrospirota bacterium]